MKRLVVAGGLALGLALLASGAYAQHGAVRGKVKDEQGKPVAGAMVTLEYQEGVTQKYETQTDKKGEFIQVGVRSGRYRITVTAESFQGTYIDYKVRLGETTYLPDFLLRSAEVAAQQAAAEGLAKVQEAFTAAIALTQAGQWDEAEAAFKGIIEESPSVPEAHYNLGYVYAQKQDWASAIAAYEKALELKPDYGDAYVALSRAYKESGQSEKAQEILEKAAAENEGDGMVQFNLGISHLNAGRSAEAEAAFEKARAANPDFAESYFHLGTLMVGQNKIPEAIELLEKYLSMNPENQQNIATAQGLLGALKPK